MALLATLMFLVALAGPAAAGAADLTLTAPYAGGGGSQQCSSNPGVVCEANWSAGIDGHLSASASLTGVSSCVSDCVNNFGEAVAQIRAVHDVPKRLRQIQYVITVDVSKAQAAATRLGTATLFLRADASCSGCTTRTAVESLAGAGNLVPFDSQPGSRTLNLTMSSGSNARLPTGQYTVTVTMQALVFLASGSASADAAGVVQRIDATFVR